MRTGTIIAGLVILCCLVGCTKKPTPKTKALNGVHLLGIETPKEVMEGKVAIATATWSGGTPPFKIKWTFNRAIDPIIEMNISSPSTIEFLIPKRNATFGRDYSIMATLTDAKGDTSTSYDRFIFIRDPLKSSPGMLRAPAH